MDKMLWNKCVDFHGHECPGLAIGFRACEIACDLLKLTFSKDEEVVCVTENDACGVDAVQVITGCTFGKGNLLYRGTGKMAFSFFCRQTGESLRILFQPKEKLQERQAMQEKILTGAVEELFKISKPTYEVPKRARLFQNIQCELCEETAPEHKVRMMDGKKVCLDCFEEYKREVEIK